jgi:hypothetical protein
MSSSQAEDLQALRHDADRLAHQLPRAGSKDEALSIAIQAAETCLRALVLVDDPSEKAQCRRRAERYMQEAESIKHNKIWLSAVPPRSTVVPAHQLRVLREPVSTRQLSKREQIILLKAGFLNGVKFPAWSCDPPPSEFELKHGEVLFLYVSLPVPTFPISSFSS